MSGLLQRSQTLQRILSRWPEATEGEKVSLVREAVEVELPVEIYTSDVGTSLVRVCIGGQDLGMMDWREVFPPEVDIR